MCLYELKCVSFTRLMRDDKGGFLNFERKKKKKKKRKKMRVLVSWRREMRRITWRGKSVILQNESE